MGVKTGKGWNLPIIVLVDIYIIWVVTSIAGLAVSPIIGDLKTIFPGSTELETQFIVTMPSVAAIPFVFLGGALGIKFNNLWLINISCLIFLVAGCLFFVADRMWQLIALSVIAGIGAGMLSPLSVTVLSNIFTGKYKTKQFGITSALLNAVLVIAVIVTGYMADVSWRLPFVWYLMPIIPIILSPWLKKYIVEPKKMKADAEAKTKHKFSFTKECNVLALVKYCIFYGFITFVVCSTSLFIPYMMKSYGFGSGVTGDLTSVVYFGIMLSGFLLNPILGILKKTTFDMIILGLALGFFLVIISKSLIIIGLGIFIGSFFYGVGQPYCYNVTTTVCTPVAASLTMAWLIIMDSVGVLLCPIIINFLQAAFHAKDIPQFPFYIILGLCIVAWVLVLLKRLLKRKPSKAFIFREGFKKLSELTPAQQSYILKNRADAYDLDIIDNPEVATVAPAPASSASSSSPASNSEPNNTSK